MRYNRDTLQDYVARRLITERKHPELDLWIYNYTAHCQYSGAWDDITMACRGLILNQNGIVVANPFPKFFNLEEYQDGQLGKLPTGGFQVFEKLDGSLGISYYANGRWSLASRGSFTSEQAIVGTNLLRQHDPSDLDPSNTYLFEIIYPGNRIVVDYHGESKIVLLSIRDTDTGTELYPGLGGFTSASRYIFLKNYQNIRELIDPTNREGFVVLFDSGERVKLKFREYVQLHRVVSGLTEKFIWKYLSGKCDLPALAGLPDEVATDVERMIVDMRGRFFDVESACRCDFRTDFPTRKATAEYFLTCRYPAVLFKMLDGRDYSETIWKLLKPKARDDTFSNR
jgi:RNA ligase